MSWLRWIPERGTLPPSPPMEASPDESALPVLFVHGVLGSPGNFEVPATMLAERGRAFVAPAYGEHGTGPIEESFEQILGFVEKQGLKRIDVVGHSLGGLMGLRLARRHPTLVRRLVGLGACYRGAPRHYHAPGVVKTVLGQAYLDLSTRFDAPMPEHTEVVSIVSDNDWIVPNFSSELGTVLRVSTRHEHLPRLGTEILDALSMELEL